MDKSLPPIEVGQDVFVLDDDGTPGAVREVEPRAIRVFVENSGDFEGPRTAVMEVVAGKVVLDCSRLDAGLRRAIAGGS